MMTRGRGTLLVGITLLASGVAVFVKKTETFSARQKTPPVLASHAARASASPITRPDRVLPRAVPAPLPKPVYSPHVSGSLEGEEWVTARITAIQDLGWFDDAESLRKILAELRNPLPEIRAAAVAATRAYGSRDAIPYLTIKAEETGDPLEQKALMDLVEHLKLPTVVEQLESESEE
jgi:HEAT repeats